MVSVVETAAVEVVGQRIRVRQRMQRIALFTARCIAVAVRCTAIRRRSACRRRANLERCRVQKLTPIRPVTTPTMMALAMIAGGPEEKGADVVARRLAAGRPISAGANPVMPETATVRISIRSTP